MTFKEYYDTCIKIINEIAESEEAKAMRFTVEDLRIIIDALDDTLIVQQAISLVHRSQHEREEIKRRIDRTTRTKAKLMLMLKDAIED